MAKNVSNGFRKVTHCIFDMDGLLLDTEPAYEEIVRQIARAFGKPYPFEVRMKIMGTTDQRSAQIAVNDLHLPISVGEYLERYYKLCGELLGNAPLLKGAERLIRHLHDHNIPFALATSSGAEMVDLKTSHHQELFKMFHHRVCGSSDPGVKEGKPAPDIFLVAAERFPDNPQPNNCLAFEDAPNGVKAAISAGMQCVMVPDDHVPRDMCTLATQVLKSLEQFDPEHFGLPPYKA